MTATTRFGVEGSGEGLAAQRGATDSRPASPTLGQRSARLEGRPRRLTPGCVAVPVVIYHEDGRADGSVRVTVLPVAVILSRPEGVETLPLVPAARDSEFPPSDSGLTAPELDDALREHYVELAFTRLDWEADGVVVEAAPYTAELPSR